MSAASARASPEKRSAPTGGEPGEAQNAESGRLDAKLITLSALAADINVEHQAAEQHARSAIGHAITCGQLLAEAKNQVGHGAWLPWLATHVAGSARTASSYVRLAMNRQRVADMGSVREALEHLSEPRDVHHDVLARYDSMCAEVGRAFEMLKRLTNAGVGNLDAVIRQCERAQHAAAEALAHDDVATALTAGQITELQALACYAAQSNRNPEEQMMRVRVMWERECDKILREIDELREGGN